MSTRMPDLLAKLFFALSLVTLAFALPQNRVEADDLCPGTTKETCEADHEKCQNEYGPRAQCIWSEAIDKCGCGRPDNQEG